MKTPSLYKRNLRKSSAPIKCLIAAAMLSTFSTSAFAGWVIDPTHIIQNVVNSGREYGEAYKQLQEAKKQLDEAKKLVAKLQGLTNSQMEMTLDLETRSPNHQMELYCPGAGNGVLASLKGALSINPDGNIKEQQKKVCQNMVMARNEQYNEAVRMLKSVKERNKELAALEERRKGVINSGGEMGDMTAVNLDFQQLATRINIDTQYSNSVIGAYDTYVTTLESTQAQLARKGLSGNSGNKTFAEELVGKFVQGAALEVGLQAARTRDR